MQRANDRTRVYVWLCRSLERIFTEFDIPVKCDIQPNRYNRNLAALVLKLGDQIIYGEQVRLEGDAHGGLRLKIEDTRFPLDLKIHFGKFPERELWERFHQAVCGSALMLKLLFMVLLAERRMRHR